MRLDAYKRLRHDAIYGLDLTLDEAEARAALESATALLQEVKAFMGVK